MSCYEFFLFFVRKFLCQSKEILGFYHTFSGCVIKPKDTLYIIYKYIFSLIIKRQQFLFLRP